MSVIPCRKNAKLVTMIHEYAEALKQDGHLLGKHGLSEREFHDSGLFRGAIERIRGQFSAAMKEKREFVSIILDHMKQGGFIQVWNSAGESNRYDYEIALLSGKTAAIELKGCLDGNNTNIFERPHNADEFVLWSVCTSPGADPRHNVWSGIHTRLSAEIISRGQRVDGLIVWDMACATHGRPCPKLLGNRTQRTQVGPYALPPPCLYLFPATVPNARSNPQPDAQKLEDVEILQAFHDCFGGVEDFVNFVRIKVAHEGPETVRTTQVMRANRMRRESAPTPIRRF